MDMRGITQAMAVFTFISLGFVFTVMFVPRLFNQKAESQSVTALKAEIIAELEFSKPNRLAKVTYLGNDLQYGFTTLSDADLAQARIPLEGNFWQIGELLPGFGRYSSQSDQWLEFTYFKINLSPPLVLRNFSTNISVYVHPAIWLRFDKETGQLDTLEEVYYSTDTRSWSRKLVEARQGLAVMEAMVR